MRDSNTLHVSPLFPGMGLIHCLPWIHEKSIGSEGIRGVWTFHIITELLAEKSNDALWGATGRI
jgi:hypothetical protein